MTKGGLKFFVIVVLVLGAFVAFGEIFYSVFNIKPEPLDPTYIVSDKLDSELHVDFLEKFSTRAKKYLKVSVEDFENSVTPESMREQDEEDLEETGDIDGESELGDLP